MITLLLLDQGSDKNSLYKMIFSIHYMYILTQSDLVWLKTLIHMKGLIYLWGFKPNALSFKATPNFV